MRTEILQTVEVANVGLATFGDALREQGAPVVDVDWSPPAEGDPDVLEVLTRLYGTHGDRVAEANRITVERIEAARPRAVAVEAAGDVIEGLTDRMLLHSGPPIEWDRVCDPQARALTAACLLEGWASDRDEAARLIADGEVELASGNEHDHVGTMTGVCSPSMPVWVMEDEDSGARAYATLNEGPGKTFWLGVGDDESVELQRFMKDRLAPVFEGLIEEMGPVDVFSLAAQGLQMGDELHMRSQATTNLLLRELLPALVVSGDRDVARFLAGNRHFFLGLTIAAAKCTALAAAGERGSTIVHSISRNGTDFGLQVASMPGRWFEAPAPPVSDALLYEGYDEQDKALDIGDSAVIECVGLGGMTIGASPAVAGFFGGSAADAVERTRVLAEICGARSARFLIPALGYAGSGVGIDARLVVELGITPQITTGVLHASSGAGQIGAGVAHAPAEPFLAALSAVADRLDEES
ncbi:MAG: DUF1116 domain-containing protein [Thermoleophilaceae bacterium]